MYDPSLHGVLVFGGMRTGRNCVSSFLNDTWVINGTRGIRLHPAYSPSPRAYAAAT